MDKRSNKEGPVGNSIRVIKNECIESLFCELHSPAYTLNRLILRKNAIINESIRSACRIHSRFGSDENAPGKTAENIQEEITGLS